MTNSNGHDDSQITKFPTPKEREVMEAAHLVRHRSTPPEEPILNLPPMIKALCLINAAIFILTNFFPDLVTETYIYNMAFVPARYFSSEPLGFAGILSPLTHMFIHAGWLHLGMNISMLMAFGTGLEQAIGARRLLLFYLVTGLCGALLHTLVYPDMEAPMIGASGAISGLFGGIMMLMYEEGMMGQGYKKLLPFTAVWIGVSIFFGVFGLPGTDHPVAWTTHIGGFIAGLLLYKPISRLKIQH
ncbi:MAG: rhomboid family intramembrane serine protease [Proteobacteria bacterium]|nr:rhomboid family intramembrane serine protease [Pseudomonadota bacterium]